MDAELFKTAKTLTFRIERMQDHIADIESMPKDKQTALAVWNNSIKDKRVYLDNDIIDSKSFIDAYLDKCKVLLQEYKTEFEKL